MRRSGLLSLLLLSSAGTNTDSPALDNTCCLMPTRDTAGDLPAVRQRLVAARAAVRSSGARRHLHPLAVAAACRIYLALLRFLSLIKHSSLFLTFFDRHHQPSAITPVSPIGLRSPGAAPPRHRRRPEIDELMIEP